MILGGGLERFEQDVGVVGVTAQAAAGDQQRAQGRDAVVGGEREQRVAGGAGGGVEHAGERVVGALGGELGVAQDERADGVAAVLVLVREHVDEPERLGLRAGQQAVDLGRAAADALAGEVEAELAQRGGDRVVAVGGLARRIGARGSAARSPRAGRASHRGRAGGGTARRGARRAGSAGPPESRKRMPARASFGLRFWNSGQHSSVSSSAERRRSCRRLITHSGKSPSSCRVVTSSRKRVSCSASQSRSTAAAR